MAETQPYPAQALCYTFDELRENLADQVCGEGVVDVAGGDLLVTTGGAGLDLSVAAGAAYILNDESTGLAQMYVVRNDAAVTLTATTADGSNPRVDTVVATVSDSEYPAGTDTWALSIVAGTPAGAAALTDAGIAASAAAVPDNSVVLAYVLVPTSFAGPFVDATHILDARNNYFKCGSAPWVSVEASAATSSADGSYTQTALATLIHRDRDFFTVTAGATPTVTVLQAGLYDVSAMAGFSAITSAGGDRVATIRKNNTNLPNATPDGLIVAEGRISHDATEAATSVIFTPNRAQLVLAANDTLKLATFQDTGTGAKNTFHSAGVFVAHLTVRKVG